jgi:hypothetical protein
MGQIDDDMPSIPYIVSNIGTYRRWVRDPYRKIFPGRPTADPDPDRGRACDDNISERKRVICFSMFYQD